LSEWCGQANNKINKEKIKATKSVNVRKTFEDSMVPLHAEQGLTVNGLMISAATPEHRAEKLTLHFPLEMPAAAGWATSGYTISTSNGTNSITVTPPAGNLFFRLKQ